MLVQLRPRDIRTDQRLTCTKHLHRSFLTSLCFGDPIVSLPSAGRIRNNNCYPLIYYTLTLFYSHCLWWTGTLCWINTPPSFFLPPFLPNLPFFPSYFSVAWKPHVRMSCLFRWTWEQNIPMCFKSARVDCFFIYGYSGMHEEATDTAKVRSDSWTLPSCCSLSSYIVDSYSFALDRMWPNTVMC